MPRKRPAARALTAIRHWITGAPGTYAWLTLLLVTTVVLHRLAPDFEREFLVQRSADVHELTRDPLRVLVSGALWTGGHWLLYAALFTVFHATAEHWLGTPRWLAVAAAAQFLAPFVTAAALTWAVHHGHAPRYAALTLDTGPGYALAGVAAVLTYRIPHPWRALYAFAVLVAHGVPLVSGRTFAELGHCTAVLTGFACYPLVRGLPRRKTGRAPRSNVPAQ
ncbi:rhomboid-like protein [Streptomyces sp. 24-1644]|uniref:rhomboid-like protein n=1 Tax=Streptomyces sp. 24-1644 TaxID=3457315 RepID=UPI003FA6A9DB